MEQETKSIEAHRNGHTPPNGLPAAAGALEIMWDGLPPAVAERLAQPLDVSLVSYRKGRGGRSFPFVEGHTAIAQANRIFGYGSWGYEVLDVSPREIRTVEEKHALSNAEGTGEARSAILYWATVRVQVPGVPTRTDVGCHAVAEETQDGHDTACKGAVTDALKRALRSFGEQFGNGLYGAGAADPLAPALRESLQELGKALGLTGERLREAVRKRTGKDMESLSAPELAPLVRAMARKVQKTDSPPSAPAAEPSSPR